MLAGEINIYLGTIGVPKLIASALGISGAALASTALTFVSGVTLGTFTPKLVIFKYASGTIGINQSRIKTDAGYLLAATLLTTLDGTDNNYIVPLSGIVRSTGNISVEVTTASLGASTFDVFVYGIQKP